MIDASLFDNQAIYDKLYKPIPKALEFFAAEHKARQLLWLGAVRSRKTSSVVRGISYHIRGVYPDWWTGYRYNRPVRVLMATVKMQKTRDVLQKYLLEGDPIENLTPCIHRNLIVDTFPAHGTKGAFEKVLIKSKFNGNSSTTFGAFSEGASAWQSVTYDIVLLDEVPSIHLYSEAFSRTASFSKDKTFVYLTMWPEKGMDELVTKFWNNAPAGEAKNDHFYMMSSWSDNPGLSEEEKERMRQGFPAWQLQAREHGIPVFGHGKVFTMDEAELFIKRSDLPSELPKHWGYVYGLDPSSTSGGTWGMVLLTYDRDNDIVYVIKDYKKTELTPVEHGYNISQLVPDWCSGVNDPAGAGEDMHNKEKTIDFLKKTCRLKLVGADKSNGTKEATIDEVFTRLRSGKIKIVADLCPNLVEEWRRYSRDDQGNIIKKNDHCIDAFFYALNKVKLAISEAQYNRRQQPNNYYGNYNKAGLM